MFVAEGLYAEPITVNITSNTGRKMLIHVDSEDSIADLKTTIYNVSQIMTISQSLEKDGVQLKDNNTLASYSISDGDTITLERVAAKNTHKPKSGLIKYFIILAVLALIAVAGKFLLFPKDDNPFAEYEDNRGPRG